MARVIQLWAEVVWNQRDRVSDLPVDREVVFENVPTQEVTRGRDDVLAILRGFDRPPRLTRVESFELGDRVFLFSEGPDLHAGGRKGPEGRSFLVFVFDNGVLKAIRSYANREDAF